MQGSGFLDRVVACSKENGTGNGFRMAMHWGLLQMRSLSHIQGAPGWWSADLGIE